MYIYVLLLGGNGEGDGGTEGRGNGGTEVVVELPTTNESVGLRKVPKVRVSVCNFKYSRHDTRNNS